MLTRRSVLQSLTALPALTLTAPAKPVTPKLAEDSFADYGYQKEIAEALRDENIRTVVVMGCAKSRKSHLVGCFMDDLQRQGIPGVLSVYPGVRLSGWTDLNSSLGPMRDLTSRTAVNEPSTGGRWGIAHYPWNVVLAEEIDRWPDELPYDHPLTIIRKNLHSQYYAKSVLFCSPAGKNSAIAEAYAQSDQRHFGITCPRCRRTQELVWWQVRWHNDDPQTAYCECFHCGDRWDDKTRRGILSNGHWLKWKDSPQIAGFHIWSAMLPFPLSETVKRFLEAKNDPARLREWVQTDYGRPWRCN